MADFDRLGSFYLGRPYDLGARAAQPGVVTCDAKDLTTHAVIIGMTGSGKTGLGIGLLEEALLDGIPVIAVDPKGDLGNLALRFPQLQGSDFAPWVDGAPFTMHFDYSYDGTMRSFEDSLQRLGLERMDVCFIHDIDVFTRGAEQPAVFEQAMDGCWRALERLRSQGLVKAIGVGVNEWQVCHEALKRRDFDCFLLAGRYTLLEQDALDEFLPLCQKRGAAVVVGGGFNSGILATGSRPGAKYNYAPAPQPILDKVARIEAVCTAHGVPLPAAALQFVVAHPAIPSFIAGTRTVEQLRQNLAWFSHPIPADFWADLKRQGLLREDAPVPAG